MLTKINNNIKYGKQHGGFGMQILYPGLIRPQPDDSGFATIGRIDHARITPGTLIPMHPHKDDEILTYLRRGKVRHFDSKGFTEIISNQKLMMMNAGSTFYHEEKVLEEGGIVESLQIFIRPGAAGLYPHVQFHALNDVYSVNQWRKIAGKGECYPLLIRSNTWIMDMRLEKGCETLLPKPQDDHIASLFYVFSGQVRVNDDMVISTGESVLIEGDNPTFKAIDTTDIILIITQKNALYFDGGMYSGNLH